MKAILRNCTSSNTSGNTRNGLMILNVYEIIKGGVRIMACLWPRRTLSLLQVFKKKEKILNSGNRKQNLWQINIT